MLQPVRHTAQPIQTETAGASSSDTADAGTAFGLVLGAIQSAQAESPPAQEGATPPANVDAEPASLLEATLGASAAMLFQMPPVAVAQAGVDPSTGLTPGAAGDSIEAAIALPPQQNLPPGPADLAALTAQAPPLNPLANDPAGQTALVAESAGRAATLQLTPGVAGLASTARAASAAAAAPASPITASTNTVSTSTVSPSAVTVDAAAGVPVAQTSPATTLAALLANNAKVPGAAQSGAQSGTPTPAKPVLASAGPLLTPGQTLFEAARQTATDPGATDTLLLNKPLDILANRVLATVSEIPPSVGRPATPSSQALPAGDTANPASLGALTGQTAPSSEAVQSANRVVSHVAAPLLSREWRNELSDRVAWMVGRQAQSAEIILNPPALGSIEVRLNMNLTGNEAGAQFFSANANVRDALESAFPRLRELMANMGITLGEASVSSQSFGERPTGSESGQTSGKGVEPALFSAAVPGALLTGTARSQGLVDLYI